jgi:hypothetical protein
MHLLYSRTFWGYAQKCTGVDQLLLARGPWEDEPIFIRGIALTHRVYPPTDDALAMAGSSAIDGDILCHVSGSGTAQIMFPEGTGFLFPGRPSDCHLDVHAWCATGWKHEVCLTVFYQKPVPALPEPKSVPRLEDDRLPQIARLLPEYQPVAPDPPPPDPPPLNFFGWLAQWWPFSYLLPRMSSAWHRHESSEGRPEHRGRE